MKKISCLFFAVLLMLSMLTVASAENRYKSLLLLGDSITFGYGLEGGKDSPDNYGNLLRNYLKIDASNYKNAAVNGDASEDLLKLIPTLKDDIAFADLIVVSIGGNDLLRLLWDAVTEVSGPGWTFDDVMEGLKDSEYIGKIIGHLTYEKIISAVADYSVNLAAIINEIERINPGARLIFLAQYNPTSGYLPLADVNGITIFSVGLLNAAMLNTINISGGEYLDIYTEFLGKGPELTFISEGDIHPNTAGHKKIFEAIVKHLESTPKDSETTHPSDSKDTSMSVETADNRPVQQASATDDNNYNKTDVTSVNIENHSDESSKGGKRGVFGCRSATELPAVLSAAVLSLLIVPRRKRVTI